MICEVIGNDGLMDYITYLDLVWLRKYVYGESVGSFADSFGHIVAAW